MSHIRDKADTGLRLERRLPVQAPAGLYAMLAAEVRSHGAWVAAMQEGLARVEALLPGRD